MTNLTTITTKWGTYTVHRHWVTPGPKEVLAMKEYRKGKYRGTD